MSLRMSKTLALRSMSPSSWSLSTAAAVTGLERLARRKSEAGVTGTLPDLSARPYAFVRTTDPFRARATAPPGMFHFDIERGDDALEALFRRYALGAVVARRLAAGAAREREGEGEDESERVRGARRVMFHGNSGAY